MSVHASFPTCNDLRDKLLMAAAEQTMPGAIRMCHRLASMVNEPAPRWWFCEMMTSLTQGWVHWIPNRARTDLYLARFWITPPETNYAVEGIEEPPLESGNSLLLHWFNSGDDDRALHDHPWDFRTTIMQGAYMEHLPEDYWLAALPSPLDPGPSWDANRVFRSEGQTICHAAEDLHCVGDTMLDTVTLVRTGSRRRVWGFHPPGKPWLMSAAFLNKTAAPQPQPSP